MGKNLLPPGAETFLSSQTGNQLVSALSSVYQNTMVETAVKSYLTKLGIDLGVPKPPILFSDDDLWRSIIRALAFEKRHTRLGVAKVMELLLRPQVSQATTLSRTIYKNIAVNNSLTILAGPNAAGSPYTVAEVLTHHLIFPPGTFTLPESDVNYSIEGTISNTGSLVELADGKHALVDYTVSFVNTHPKDYLTNLNRNIPQYGKVIFNKNSNVSSIPPITLDYEFYDRSRTGILKLDPNGPVPSTTLNRWEPIRSTTLKEPAKSGALSVRLSSVANIPAAPAPVSTIQAGIDRVKILTPGVAGGPFLINSVTKHEITLGAPAFTVPAGPTTTEIIYEIETTPGDGFLSNGRGHFLSKKGKILSTTKLFDPTVDFTEPLRYWDAGSREPFLVTINRGEDNEETIEVVYRDGDALYLVPNPADATGATSLLKYTHDIGEPVEVYNKNTSTAGTYFPLSAAGATVSTATAGSTTTDLFDSTNPFVALNADVTFGDEVELVTVPAGNANAVGERRQIDNFTAANRVRVTPAFTDTLLGCTYRIRKLYKAGLDNHLYVSDSSVFPAENFSIILNRGKDDEEVVWCGTASNNLTLNRLTIANNDDGAAFVSKNHNFGVTVEPAQVLVEGCNWEIIETKATGEYTVAVENECVPDLDLAGWFLHEETPHWLLSTSSGPPGPTGQISTSGRFPGSLFLPGCNPASPINASDTQIFVSADNFLRLFANRPDAHNTQSINEVFRPIILNSSAPIATKELFVTTAERTAILAKNVLSGKSTIYTDKELLSAAGNNEYKLGANGNAYPTRYNPGSPSSNSLVELITVTNSVLVASGLYENTLSVAVKHNHFEGESLINNQTPLNLTQPVGVTIATATNAYITLLGAHPHYRYKDDMTRTSEAVFFTSAALPVVRNDYVVCATGKFIPKNVIGKILYIVDSGTNNEGERRRIVSIGGPENNYIFVEPDFSLPVNAGVRFCIESVVQTADATSSALVPLGNENSAFPAPLNAVNTNLYEGGHKSIYPGSYVFNLLNQDSEPVDQASSTTAFLLPQGSHDVGTPSAVYKFPGPRRLIAPPLIPCGMTTSSALNTTTLIDTVRLDPAVLGPLFPSGNAADIVGRFVQILGSDVLNLQRSDWRKVFKITAYDPAARSITVEGEFSSFVSLNVYYRVLGDSSSPVLIPGGSEFWVDYPELFPDPPQGNFTVTLARKELSEIDLNIIACVNTMGAGANYGKFTIGSTSPNLSDNYHAGTQVELKVTQIALPITPPTGTMPTTGGGFYCEYGYEDTKITQEESGLSHYLGEVSDPIDLGGTESKVTYVTETDPIKIKKGLYLDTPGNLTLPISTTKTVSFRTETVANSAPDSLSGVPVTVFKVLNDNFLNKFYQDSYVGGKLLVEVVPSGGATSPELLTLDILHVIPKSGSGCAIWTTEIPAADWNLPVPAGTTITVRSQVKTDDHESFLEENAHVALKLALTVARVDNRQFVNLLSTAIATGPQAIVCDGIAPISTALIGRAVKITDYDNVIPLAKGDVRTIVSVTESTPTLGFDQINVDRNFSAAIPPGTTFEIMPVEDPLYGSPRKNYSNTGGVYTPISHEYPTLFGAPGYPLSNSGDTRFPAGREYGILQEYIKYSKRVNNILTLSAPHYFKYDHPPGTKISLGTGKKITAGDGTDFRPYLFGAGYLALIFDSNVGFKNLFTAAGIECKTEETELGP